MDSSEEQQEQIKTDNTGKEAIRSSVLRMFVALTF